MQLDDLKRQLFATIADTPSLEDLDSRLDRLGNFRTLCRRAVS
jgi:hypothetical protein